MSQPTPKKCAACGQPAVLFVGFVTGGKVHSQAWCEEHAAAQGLADLQGYALAEEETAADRPGESTLRCAGCDCSQRDFERQGRFGCPVCYTTFAGLLSPLLNRMHRGDVHCGKIPLRGADTAIIRHRLSRLNIELSDAVRTEQFEGAAQTRDAIALLNAKLLAADLPTEKIHSPAAKMTGK